MNPALAPTRKQWFPHPKIRRGVHLALRLPTIREQRAASRWIARIAAMVMGGLATSIVLAVILPNPFTLASCLVAAFGTIFLIGLFDLWERFREPRILRPSFAVESSGEGAPAGEEMAFRVESSAISGTNHIRVALLQIAIRTEGRERIEELKSTTILVDAPHDGSGVWKGTIRVPDGVASTVIILGLKSTISRVLFCFSGPGVHKVDGVEITHPMAEKKTAGGYFA